MFRTITTVLIGALLVTIFVVHTDARGRSVPIDVTGIIKLFDRANHVLTIQVNQPAEVLSIAVARDCKFIQNGTLTGEQILKNGAQVKVSYVSTIFSGKIAVKIELNPMPQDKNLPSI
jgi:hypothetical protein